jgi:uncharacterized protein YciI
MKYFLLFYDVVENFAERRMPFRGVHLNQVHEYFNRGDIVMAGPVGDPIERAMLIFRVADAATVEHFAKTDPYVTNGVVTRWEIKPWTVAVGAAQ